MIGKTLKELGKALTEKKISSVELTQLHLDRIARLNPEINAFITVDRDGALGPQFRQGGFDRRAHIGGQPVAEELARQADAQPGQRPLELATKIFRRLLDAG